MPMDEESALFHFGEGCPIHGETRMKECSMCGAEFCGRCFPRSTVCPDCADTPEEEEEEEPSQNPDFEDVSNLDEVLGGEESEKAPDEDEDEEDLSEDELPDEDK